MSALLILASLAGFLAFENKSKKTIITTSQIKINSECTKFISPVELTKTGFGFNKRSLGLSGLFLQQYSWSKVKEELIIEQYKKLDIKDFENLFNVSENIKADFYKNCKSKKSESEEGSENDFITLKEYLEIDTFLNVIFTLFVNNILTDLNVSNGMSFIDEKYKKGKYIYSSEDIKLVSTKNDSIVSYYKSLFKLLPQYKSIPTKILTTNELLRSSIKYIKEENIYKFYNYPDSEIARLNWLIGLAKN